MDIYNLNGQELKKVRRDFFKTGIGFIVTTFGCFIPLGLMLISVILLLSEFFCLVFEEGTGDFYLVFIIASITMIGSCITTILYTKMLKDYAEKKTSKK